MKVPVSNIAWPVEQDAAVAESLAGIGVTGVEIAPTKVWPSPTEATDAEVDAYRHFWESRGLTVVAAQALLFGSPDLTLFDDAETRGRTLDYLTGVVRVCARLGAKALVFGSPKNRRTDGRDRASVWSEAVVFFGRLGEVATREGTAVVMEANPPDYGDDFVTLAAEALELVRAVNLPGFRLHLDAACMTMSGDDPDAVISEAGPLLAHFHASEPNLDPVGQGATDHARFARALASAGYDGWVSIEMRQVEPFEMRALERAFTLVQAVYL